MNNLLVRIQTHKNPKLNDDEVVERCMTALMEQKPEIKYYTYERTGENEIQILMWGDFRTE